MSGLEKHFEKFRRNTVGYEQRVATPYGLKRLVYADWTATGRLYRPVEGLLTDTFGPFYGNTHSGSSETGRVMTEAYAAARDIIRAHVNASKDDLLVTCGYGMTAAVNKLQRLLGLRVPEQLRPLVGLRQDSRPLVVTTHMEHHSNHTSWLETLADVVLIRPDTKGLVDLDSLDDILRRHRHRPLKIGTFTACSNVTGIRPPYHQMARIMHEHGGLCFVDFSSSAPYVSMNMHPYAKMEHLDGLFYSPHKFLGGPGSCGVLVFNSGLYSNKAPDTVGGGTVKWTNPWGGRRFLDDVEAREDGGTPGILQTIRAALAIKLKQQLSVDKMLSREAEILQALMPGLLSTSGVRVLAGDIRERLAIVSFCVEEMHYNLVVRVLNDYYGIQSRGGCSCAGTYGHFLLHIGREESQAITDRIDRGDLQAKPGWVRISLHPTTTTGEVLYILDAIREIATNRRQWSCEYAYDAATNEFVYKRSSPPRPDVAREWFRFR
ncbi:MAG: aminotransferase class V-fold PLP-dependent enzyme [Bacillota bacterium]|nr:aminotransferase class V-fold PLP-dependent enzyme [Bacillota bacterium]